MKAIRFVRTGKMTYVKIENDKAKFYRDDLQEIVYPKSEADAEFARLEEQVVYEQQRNANNVALYEKQCRELEAEVKRFKTVLESIQEFDCSGVIGCYNCLGYCPSCIAKQALSGGR
jgi:hypothetical protein